MPAWNYCLLFLDNLTADPQGKIRCDLFVRYFGSHVEVISRSSGKETQEWDHNPWDAAVARLGNEGWELVSVQHANSAGDMGGGGEIARQNAVAYFKRPLP